MVQRWSVLVGKWRVGKDLLHPTVLQIKFTAELVRVQGSRTEPLKSKRAQKCNLDPLHECSNQSSFEKCDSEDLHVSCSEKLSTQCAQ